MLQKTHDTYKGRLAVLAILVMLFLLTLAVVENLSIISKSDSFESVMLSLLVLNVPLILILAFLFVCLNRCCCKVYFDFQNQKLIRKGYICGYRSELNFQDIEKVVLVMDLYDKKEYIYILDTINKSFSDLWKKSFFRMENNLDNIKLVSQVWEDNIEIMPSMFIAF